MDTETKVTFCNGEEQLQNAIVNYGAQGWEPQHITRGTLGRITIVWQRPLPPRPDLGARAGF